MSAAHSLRSEWRPGSPPRRTTLLELVCAVGEVTHDERELVATVLHLLESGRVTLCGNFRGVSPKALR